MGLLLTVLYPAHQPKRKTTQGLINIPFSNIRSIAVIQKGHLHFKLQRIRHKWWVTAPFKMGGKRAAIRNLLKLLNHAPKHRYAINKINAKSAGLTHPQLKVTVNHAELTFGDLNPVSYLRYVRSGSQVFLTSEWLYYRLSSGPYAYTSKRLVPSGSKLVSVTLLTKHQSNNEHAVSANSKKTFYQWRHTRAEAVGPMSKKLPPTLPEITIRCKQGIVIHYYIKRTKAFVEFIRRDPDLVYRLAPKAAQNLLSPFTIRAGIPATKIDHAGTTRG